MRLEIVHSTGGKGMGDNFALPRMLRSITDIKDSWNTGDKGLVEVTEEMMSDLSPMRGTGGRLLFKKSISMCVDGM